MSNQSQAGMSVVYTDPTGYRRQLITQFIPHNYGAVTLNQASGTTPQIIVAGVSGQYLFATTVKITVDPTATIAAAGMVTVNVSDSNDGIIHQTRLYIPATAGAPTIPTAIQFTNPPGFFFGASTPGSNLSVVLNTALTAASIRCSIHYGLSDVPIGNF